MSSTIKRAWSWYSGCLSRNPFTTKTITSSVIVGFGDIVAQSISIFSHKNEMIINSPTSYSSSPSTSLVRRWREEYNPVRTLKMAFVGYSVVGISSYFWFKWLERFMPGSTLKQVIPKLVVDQLIFSPYMLASNFLMVSALNGKSKDEIKTKMEKDFVPTLYVNWMVWPFASFVNFWLIPYHYRILFANGVSLGWNTYLSIVTNKSSK
eukprot:TRINITY_DN3401_c0_g1_i1.p1 TRINITY_DN3401_c0_g1~~TRINITY_DN3401_c0_g1_i1.p1  ORF type:complete len:208 (-),score=57.69 TRINITY_DN3401_c0_g1_i1:37-660(-)